jgi:drug/metabolite transporter (DMT)-like permease
MKSYKRYLPYLALIIAAIIWGANTPVMKLTLASVPLFSLAFLRFFVGALFLLPFVYKQLDYKKKDWFHLFLCAFLGVTIIITLYFLGLRMTSALNSGIINGIQPIVILFFAYVFLQEKITKRMILGSLVSILGLGLIIGKDILSQGFDVSPLGDTIIFLSTIIFAAYVTLSKELSKKYSPLVLTFFLFFVGGIFFLPGVVFEYTTNPTWYMQVSPLAYFGIFYGIIFSAVIAFLLWQYGLSKVSESQVGFFLYLTPVISTIAAIYFLGETITEEFLMGAMLIFIGLFISEAHLHHKKPFHH